MSGVVDRSMTNGMLAGMALLVLLMPMSYRAGTEADHPHAFFQELIDIATGTPHEHGAHVGATRPHTAGDGHHHDAGPSAAVATISPFLAADIPLAAAVEAATSPQPDRSALRAVAALQDPDAAQAPVSGTLLTNANRDAVVASLSPDLPGLTNLTPAAEKASAILLLTTILVGILLAGWHRRALWAPAMHLLAVPGRVEAPPPRLAPM